DAYTLCPKSKRHHNHNLTHCASCDKTVFAVILSVIRPKEHWLVEDPPGIRKVNSVFGYVLLVLGFIPLKLHQLCSIYDCSYTSLAKSCGALMKRVAPMSPEAAG